MRSKASRFPSYNIFLFFCTVYPATSTTLEKEPIIPLEKEPTSKPTPEKEHLCRDSTVAIPISYRNILTPYLTTNGNCQKQTDIDNQG